MVLFLLERLIHKVVLLVVQVGTQETVFASAQIFREPTVRAVLTVRHITAVVALIDGEAFVAEFGIVRIGAIDNILTRLDKLSVIAILTVFGRVDEVAIFAVSRSRGVRTVFVVHLHEIETRDGSGQLRELFEEGTSEIVISTVVTTIPGIPMPFIGQIDFIGLFSPSWFL